MKNILIFASLAAIASAIAIYFVTESNQASDDDDYITDADIDSYNWSENTGAATSY